MGQKELLIVIPAHNEAQNLPRVLDQLAEQEVDRYADILIVDDASTDDTLRLARERGCRTVSNIFRFGYGGAVQMGYKYAVRGGYSFVVQMDADGQHDACNVPVLCRRLWERDREGLRPDIVLGSRYLEGSRSFSLSWAKRVAHRLFRWLIRSATGQTVTDPTTGLQGLSRRAFSFYARYGNFDDKYPDANMLAQMALLSFRVAEVPAVMYPRTAGRSIHSGLRPVWYMVRMVYSLAAVVFRIRVLKKEIMPAPEALTGR